MNRKNGAILVSFSMLAALAAGCGDNGGTASPANGADSKALDTAKEPAELVFFSNNGDSEASFNERFGDAIRKKFPTYTIKYIQRVKGSTELPNLIASGTRFDIYFDSIGNFEGRLFEHRLESDMTELIKKHGVDLSRFEPTIIEAMKTISGGKMYGLPVFNNGMMLYHNKSIFDKFGVPYPLDGMTWDELNETAKKLTRSEGGVDYYGFMTSANHILRMNQYSIPNIDLKTETPTINNNDKWKTLYQSVFISPAQNPIYIKKMKESTLSQENTVLDAFLKDQTAAMFSYLATFPFIKTTELSTMNWDLTAMPTFKDLPGVGSQAYPSYFGITSQAKNVDAAMEVLKFLTSDEHQTSLSKKGILPVINKADVKQVLGSESVFKGKNFKGMFHNKFAPISEKAPYDAKIVSTYLKQVVPLQTGATDLNTAFRTAEEEAVKVIKEYKAANP